MFLQIVVVRLTPHALHPVLRTPLQARICAHPRAREQIIPEGYSYSNYFIAIYLLKENYASVPHGLGDEVYVKLLLQSDEYAHV